MDHSKFFTDSPGCLLSQCTARLQIHNTCWHTLVIHLPEFRVFLSFVGLFLSFYLSLHSLFSCPLFFATVFLIVTLTLTLESFHSNIPEICRSQILILDYMVIFKSPNKKKRQIKCFLLFLLDICSWRQCFPFNLFRVCHPKVPDFKVQWIMLHTKII